MRESLRRLVELQRVDDRLASVEAEANAQPERRAAAEAERQQAEEAVAGAREASEGAELQRRSLEGQLADKEELLARLEGQTFQVKSNEAYTTLLREIEQTKEAISQLETGILEAMEAIDRGREGLSTAEERFAAVSARVRNELQALDSRAAELAQEGERLGAARAEVSATVDRGLLGQYEKVAARRRPALVVVSEPVCSGCRVGIPPQNLIDMIKGEAVVTCGTCHRILVHARTLETEGSTEIPPGNPPGEG